MTATSFCDILSGKKVGLGKDKQDESIPFIFQEANFYVNKSIDKLDVMKPCAEVIFNKGVAYSKLIDAYRLETVIYILKEVRKKSYSLEKELEENGNLSQEGIQMVAKQKESDEEYNQRMRDILGSGEIKNVLEKEVKWIFRKTNEMKSDLTWKREWEANVREKARQEQVRQEQRVRQPKRKKRSYDMSL